LEALIQLVGATEQASLKRPIKRDKDDTGALELFLYSFLVFFFILFAFNVSSAFYSPDITRYLTVYP